MRVRRFFHILLLVGVITLLWQVGATWYRPLPELVAASPGSLEEVLPLPSPPAVTPEISRQLAEAIADKDLFSPSRSRIAEESSTPVKETVPPPSHLKLVGVFLSPKRAEAFFVDSSQGGKVVRVRKGEALGAYRLAQVTPLNVTLTMGQDGEEVSLALALLDSSNAAKAPRVLPAAPRPGAAKPGQPGVVPAPNPAGIPDEGGVRRDILRLQQRLRRIRQRAVREQAADEGAGNSDDQQEEEDGE